MIVVEHLSKDFKKPVRKPGLKGMIATLFSRKYEITHAVNDVNFTINDGEIVGYIGSNGAGKSTTIKMMCGILTPTAGKVVADGVEPYKAKQRNDYLKTIGVVFGQRSQLWWDLPVIESFRIIKEIYEVTEEEYQERFNYLTNILEVEKFMHSPVRTLSLGQRMRADLMAALLHNPKILFLDEPTIGLDVLVKQNILAALKDIHQRYNTTIILTTHDMSDIETLCSRIIIIDEGHMLYDGPITNIKNRFGDIRKIKIEAKEHLNQELLIAEFGDDIQVEVMSKRLTITFDAAKVHIDNILSFLINNYHVSDLSIMENSIEEVVKKIYAEKEMVV